MAWDDDTGSRHENVTLSIIGGAIGVLALFLLWNGPYIGGLQERTFDVTGARGRVANMPTRGTSGVDLTVGPALAAETNPATRRLTEFVRGIDTRQVVGRRVEMQVDLASYPSMLANAPRFWGGNADNPMLVVLRRDQRDALQSAYGQLSSQFLPFPQSGRRYRLEGTIEQLPIREQMASWGLSKGEMRQLVRWPVYVAIDTITPVG